MARVNQSRFVILGFLLDQPRSGYDIRKAIEASLGHFWSESFGQIYPALRDLEGEGLVRRVDGEGHPARQAYRITPAGRACLETWLRTPAAPLTHRVEVLVKLFFAARLGPAPGRAHVARFEAEQRERLAAYQAIRAGLERSHRDDPRLPYWELTLDFGLRVGRAYLDWCAAADAALAALENGGNHD